MEQSIEITRSIHIDVIMEFAKILADNDIAFNIENTKPAFDITFTGGGAPIEYILKVDIEDEKEAFDLVKNFYNKV